MPVGTCGLTSGCLGWKRVAVARFTEESKRQVLEATDLVELAGEYTELRRSGTDRWTGRCPLHDDRTPSFTVAPSKQLFKCFGCDVGGDVLTLVQRKEALDFPAALELLARRAGIELEREDDDPEAQARRRRRARQHELLERAAAFYAAHLRRPKSAQAERAAEYLASRGLREPILEQFGVGFAPHTKTALLPAAQKAGFTAKEISEAGLATASRRGGSPHDRFRGRIMFPVSDIRGRIVGFGARTLPEARGPKYVNSPASVIYRKSELLYGAHHARAAAAKAGVVIVVEGYTDAVAMHQAGILNTVALMGTAVSEQQIAALKRLARTVVLLLDGDDAGAEAILRAGAAAQHAGLEILVSTLAPDTDPAVLVYLHGADAIRELVAHARAFARFRVQYHVDRADVSTAEGKDLLVSQLREVFADIPPSAVREELIVLVAEHLALQPALVTSWMPTREASADEQPARCARTDVAPATIEQRTLLMRCVADPVSAKALPSGSALERLFPDVLTRRAAEHIRAHATDPATDLPADDHELVLFITSLLSAPTSVWADA